MGCGCQQEPRKTERSGVGPCEVCGYVRGDWSLKSVRYCPACKAWICEQCWNDWPARVKAALLRMTRR